MFAAASSAMRRFLTRISPNRAALARTLAMLVLTAVVLFCSTPPRDAARLWGFAIPSALLLLLVPVVRQGAANLKRRALQTLSCLGAVCAFADAGVRGFLHRVYATSPDSSFVVESIANTNAQEAREFIGSVLPTASLWIVAIALASLAAVAIVFWRSGAAACSKAMAPQSRTGRAGAWTVIVLVLLAVVVFSVRPWRDMIPLNYWPNFLQKVQASRVAWESAVQNRDDALERAKAAVESFQARRDQNLLSAEEAEHHASQDEPRTIVLVVGESTTRTHWSLYGYERNTTPELDKAEANDPRLVVVRYAWSTQPSTIASFRDMFLFPWTQGRGVQSAFDEDPQPKGTLRDDELANVFAFFEAAGWKTFWISNQDDLAIKNCFAGWANEAVYLNRRTGRSSRSLDEVVIPAVERALSNESKKKLIVVHLIGAHPHYRFRFPSSMEADWGEDAVQQRFERLGRSPWVIAAMNNYDVAMRYQDQVLSALLKRAAKAASPDQPVAWIYLSDHGQEVGDAENKTGHSPGTFDGFRIPFLLWSSDGIFKPHLEERPFRSDDLGELLLDIAGIHWAAEDPARLFLDKDYNFGRRAAELFADNHLTTEEETALMANVMSKCQKAGSGR